MTNSTTVDPLDNLDEFSDALFKGTPLKEAAEAPEDVQDEDDESGVTIEDDTLAPDDEQDDAEPEDLPDEEEKPVEQKPKSRFQERIDELTTDKKAAQREAQELRDRLEAALAKLNAVEAAPEPVQASKAESEGPSPDDLTEDGDAKYPLGEFDPAFIRDLTRHSIATEVARQKAAEAEAERQAQEQEARTALETEWSGKLEAAVKDKYPDMLEKNVILRDTFVDLDPAYGQYLAQTIMNLEYGPDVLYHLASNVDEAKKIVASGPTAATVALGRLEARFAYADEERREPKLKTSKAPEPPPHLNKGTKVSTDIPDDTDDLDAFTLKLLNKKSKPWK